MGGGGETGRPSGISAQSPASRHFNGVARRSDAGRRGEMEDNQSFVQRKRSKRNEDRCENSVGEGMRAGAPRRRSGSRVARLLLLSLNGEIAGRGREAAPIVSNGGICLRVLARNADADIRISGALVRDSWLIRATKVFVEVKFEVPSKAANYVTGDRSGVGRARSRFRMAASAGAYWLETPMPPSGFRGLPPGAVGALGEPKSSSRSSSKSLAKRPTMSWETGAGSGGPAHGFK